MHIGLDFFDASINRVAGVGYSVTRNMKKALLRALLEPTDQLRQLEASGDYTARLALLEEQKSLPWQAGLGNVLPASRHAGWQPVAGKRSRLRKKRS
ncbi:hypothetical protein LFZ31_27610 [Salmonella enterica subsp. enterica serovar Newport str. S09097]|nr:hypothetical protein LFZ31_27610 [Salmonella enterica subsp. enterica serovar Newport str. S09097]